MARWSEADLKRHQGKQLAAKPSKYRAVKTTVDGITFDSKKEAQRYHELTLMLKAKKIRDLELQPEYSLSVGRGTRECPWVTLGKYRADFRYKTVPCDFEDEETIVEDVKGVRTAIYRWKKKHVEAQYGITIREI